MSRNNGHEYYIQVGSENSTLITIQHFEDNSTLSNTHSPQPQTYM